VADGAISGILDRSVSSRVTRVAYGTNVVVPFNPGLAAHRERLHQLRPIYSGRMVIPDAFSVILRKVIPLSSEGITYSTLLVTEYSGIRNTRISLFIYKRCTERAFFENGGREDFMLSRKFVYTTIQIHGRRSR
jgi:hypothetical protein